MVNKLIEEFASLPTANIICLQQYFQDLPMESFLEIRVASNEEKDVIGKLGIVINLLKDDNQYNVYVCSPTFLRTEELFDN